MFGKKGFDATKLKATLRLCSSRFDVAQHKKAALMKQNMREVAMLLAEDPPKEEKARIRTERLIKDDYVIEAYGILQLECQLLIERVPLIKHSNNCPADLVPCVSDLIFAAPRTEISELREIRKQLVAKFGKKLATDADNNTNGVVSQRIVEKLSMDPPTAYMVQNYMAKIAKLHEVNYEPTIQLTLEEAFEPIAAPVGYSVPMAQGTGLGLVDKKPKLVPSAETPTEDDIFVASMPPANPEFQQQQPPVARAFAFAPEEDKDSKAKLPPCVKPHATAPEETADDSMSAVSSLQDEDDVIETNEEEIVVGPSVAAADNKDSSNDNTQFSVLTGLSTTETKKVDESTTRDAEEDLTETEAENEAESQHSNESIVEASPEIKPSPLEEERATPKDTLQDLRDRLASLGNQKQDADITQSVAPAEQVVVVEDIEATEPVSSEDESLLQVPGEEPSQAVEVEMLDDADSIVTECRTRTIITENADERSDAQANVKDATVDTRDTPPSPVKQSKDQEHITGAALAGGAIGGVVAGPLGAFLGAAGVAHLAANKKGKASDLARKCGKKVSKMTNKLVEKIERA